jgi:hypothetical protein
MTWTSGSEEDCTRGEVEACGDEARSVREARRCEACGGAEAILDRLMGECEDESYCIVLCCLDCRTRCLRYREASSSDDAASRGFLGSRLNLICLSTSITYFTSMFPQPQEN